MALSGAGQVARLVQALQDAPHVLEVEVRQVAGPAAKRVRDQAARNAAWSTKIPRSLVVRTQFTGARKGARVSASVVALAEIAPHARPYEGVTGNRVFYAPLFGNRDYWYAHKTRPFLLPALHANDQATIDAFRGAVNTALRAKGFLLR